VVKELDKIQVRKISKGQGVKWSKIERHDSRLKSIARVVTHRDKPDNPLNTNRFSLTKHEEPFGGKDSPPSPPKKQQQQKTLI